MTIFACFLPYSVLAPIFDIYLMDGWKGAFKIGISLLREMEGILLSMDMVEMSTYFRDNVRKDDIANKFRLFSETFKINVFHNKLTSLFRLKIRI